jgi:hypothetical protein
VTVTGKVQALAVGSALGLVAVAAQRWQPPQRKVAGRSLALVRPRAQLRMRNAARRVDCASALLALAALTDSGIEHYRGSFHNKTMYVPLAASAITLAAALSDAASPPRQRGGDGIDALAFATGLIGAGFHVYNVAKRPSGFSWLNFFYGAPLGAPGTLSLAGLLRKIAALLRARVAVCGIAPGKLLAGLVSFGLVGTSAEAALFHFRGAYHNPAMVIPVVGPPAAAGLLAQAASQSGRQHPLTRWALRLLAGIGLLGAGFHAYGIQRNMGGWRNWSQNLLNGPPLPAPPSFTALAIAGLAALQLIEQGDK